MEGIKRVLSPLLFYRVFITAVKADARFWSSRGFPDINSAFRTSPILLFFYRGSIEVSGFNTLFRTRFVFWSNSEGFSKGNFLTIFSGH